MKEDHLVTEKEFLEVLNNVKSDLKFCGYALVEHTCSLGEGWFNYRRIYKLIQLKTSKCIIVDGSKIMNCESGYELIKYFD